MERKFKRDDVVRFADGNGKMFLWGDHVEIDWMVVTGYDEDGRVEVQSDPYTFTFAEDALVKVGELHDTRYNEEGNEEYVWLTELNEPEDIDADEDDDDDDSGEQHTGHWSTFGTTYWCDTCNSPYCDLA